MSCLSVEKIWHKLFVVAVICSFEMTVTPAVAQSDETFDVVSVLSDTKTADTEVKLWRIDRPEVRKAHQAYKQIRFRPGDTIIIDAGGCVQTGGSGKTWKSYTRPMGDNSETFYSGTIRIPGVIELGDGEYARVGGVLHKEWKIPSHLPPTHPETDLYLRLGYQDDDYHDNGYYDHDDGNPPQCVNKGPAWVQIKVVSDLRVPEGPAAPSPSAGANYS